MLIEKHVRSWQAHLEQISDFLLSGQGEWWLEQENGDVEFLDGEEVATTHPQGPLLHHFRSSNFTAEEKYLGKCWKECLEKGVVQPIKVVRVEDQNGQMKVMTLLHDKTSTNSTLPLDDMQIYHLEICLMKRCYLPQLSVSEFSPMTIPTYYQVCLMKFIMMNQITSQHSFLITQQ